MSEVKTNSILSDKRNGNQRCGDKRGLEGRGGYKKEQKH